MVTNVSHDYVLDTEQLQIVEVLPNSAYQAMHLPNAESIPLKELNSDRVAHLHREQPVVVYCADAY